MSTPVEYSAPRGSRSERRRRLLVLVAAFAIAMTSLAFLADSASAKKKDDPPGQLVQIQLLAFNDYHGHLEADGNGPVGDVASAGGGEYQQVQPHRRCR